MITEIRSVHVGSLSPKAFRYVVRPSSDPDALDLTTVTAASIEVRLPDGNTATWSCAREYDPAAGTLTLTHPFEAGDLDQLGVYTAIPLLTTPDGVSDGDRRTFSVIPRGQVIR